MYKCTTDLSPRNSIIVQSINVIISVYNPDTSISTNTNINSSTRYLIPCWATVLFFRNRLNYNFFWYRFNTTRGRGILENSII